MAELTKEQKIRDRTEVPPIGRAACRYGAPMGRPPRLGGDADPDSERLFSLRKTPLPEGYDPGGAYWGLRPPGVSFYRAFCVWTGAEMFVDGRTRDLAKASVRGKFPNALFLR